MKIRYNKKKGNLFIVVAENLGEAELLHWLFDHKICRGFYTFLWLNRTDLTEKAQQFKSAFPEAIAIGFFRE